jgi:hypothetical protein
VKPKTAVTAFAILALLGIFPGCALLAKDQPETRQSRPPSRFRDRHEFAKLLSSIKRGMTDADVIRILGKPDDVRRPDEMQLWVGNSNEVWCFGADEHHLSFPTLGGIYFDSARGRKIVTEAVGGKGTPPPPSLFAEEELRKLLSMLAQRPESLVKWDPVWAIKMVNTLQPLGEGKALAAMQEFIRVTLYLENDDMMNLLLRVLYAVPKDPGYMPPFFSMVPGNSKDPRVPRYPILILGDVPLLVARHLPFTTGPSQDFAKQVGFFRGHMTIRGKPLRPTDKPLSLYSDWKTYEWLYRDRQKTLRRLQIAEENWESDRVKSQLRKLVKTVYRGDMEKGSLSEPVRWDMKRNIYTFLDGKTLPGSLEQHKRELR